MTKLRLLLILLCSTLLLNSCKKDETKYARVKYVTNYCPKTGASMVNVETGTEAGNQIALLNVPQTYQVRDKIFLVTYHYDEALDKLDEGKICPAIFGPLKIFVCDSATEPTL